MKLIDGFKVVNKVKHNQLGAYIYEIEHIKTKGRIIWTDADEEVKHVKITFNTPLINNKGISHVLEHLVLNGSVNYPYPSICIKLSDLSYAVNNNARTSKLNTEYVFEDIFEEDLLLNFKIYMDCLYKPLFLKEKNIFLTEGVRLVYDYENDKILANGVVYNEMKKIKAEAKKESEVGSILNVGSYSVGGIPTNILDLKYEEELNIIKNIIDRAIQMFMCTEGLI